MEHTNGDNIDNYLIFYVANGHIHHVITSNQHNFTSEHPRNDDLCVESWCLFK